MVLRGLIFAAIMFTCAAAGLVASRLWPLPESLTPRLKVGSFAEAPRSEQQRPGQPFEDPSGLPAFGDRSRAAARHELSAPLENPPATSLMLLNPGAADESSPEIEAARPSPASQETDAAKAQPIRPARQLPNGKRVHPTAPRQRKSQEQATQVPEPSASSPGRERDAAVRDFMSHNPPYRY
jgi:hypothetical protein